MRVTLRKLGFGSTPNRTPPGTILIVFDDYPSDLDVAVVFWVIVR